MASSSRCEGDSRQRSLPVWSRGSRRVQLCHLVILCAADHRKHGIIPRKKDAFLKAGLRVTVIDQAPLGSAIQAPGGYGYRRAGRLTWQWLVRLLWPVVRRSKSPALRDRFWRWVLWLRLASNAVRLGWVTARVQADCYVAEDLQSAWAALLAATVRRRPVIYDAHEIESEQGYGQEVRVQREVLRALERKVIPRVDHLVVPNRSRGAFYAERYGVRSEPVVVLNCAPAAPVPPKGRPREELRLRDHVRIVLYHGALIPHRALDNLIRSASCFEQDTVLVLIGEQGKYYEDVLAPLRDSEGLQDRVFFLAYIEPDELALYVASADLGIIIYENVNLNNYLCAPTKLYEFIQMGVPVAVCNFPEMAEFLERHQVGVAFDPRDPQSIADAVNASFARSQEDLDSIHTGLEVARAAFTWEKESLKWLELLDDVERQTVGSRPQGEPAQEDR